MNDLYKGIAGIISSTLLLTFLAIKSKSELDHHVDFTRAVRSGEKIIARDEDRLLYLEGFSSPERLTRWSNGKRQKVCMVVEEQARPRSKALKFRMDVEVIGDLVAKPVAYRIDDGGGGSFKCDTRICSWEFEYRKVIGKKSPVCINIFLPRTASVPGDPRLLGYRFGSIYYTVE